MRLGELVAAVERRFRAARLHYGHGTHNARDEAAFLVIRGLGLPFEADADTRIAPRDVERIEKLVERRIEARIPVPYLLNEAWLDGRAFYVDRRVIIPRSHIALLLREKLHPWLARTPRRILDLCTGSGCLAILAAQAFPRAEIEASDISADALAVARKNIRYHRLGGRVRVVRSDLFAALEGRYDLILTNPPYVSSAVMQKLPREYRYEPGLALAAGRKGLDLIAEILRHAPAHLVPGGILVCELGDGRRTFERRFPRLEVAWPLDEVFILETPRRPARARAIPARQ